MFDSVIVPCMYGMYASLKLLIRPLYLLCYGFFCSVSDSIQRVLLLSLPLNKLLRAMWLIYFVFVDLISLKAVCSYRRMIWSVSSVIRTKKERCKKVALFYLIHCLPMGTSFVFSASIFLLYTDLFNKLLNLCDWCAFVFVDSNKLDQ